MYICGFAADRFCQHRCLQVVPAKAKSTYDSLVELVSEESNFAKLRERLAQTGGFCLPYLGMCARVRARVCVCVWSKRFVCAGCVREWG